MLLDFYPRTTLILDALDECLDRAILLNSLEAVAAKSKQPIKILISSRPEGDIRRSLSHLTNIEITEAKNDKDITAFIHSTIDTSNYQWTSTLSKSPALKNDVVTTVVSKSRGMFQWAKLQIEQLRELDHEHAIRERLGALPKDLTATYDEIFDKISSRGEKARDTVIRALCWISYSFRPLTTDEILGASCIDTDSEEIDLSFVATEQHLRDWSASLLVLDSTSESPVWRPSHFSVVEYFERREGMSPSRMRSLVAKGCLVVLLKIPTGQYQNSEGYVVGPGPSFDDEIIFPKFGGNEDCFLNSRLFYSIWQYVIQLWPRHLQSQESPDCDFQVMELLRRFLGSPLTPSAAFQQWHKSMVYGRNETDIRWKYSAVGVKFVPSHMYISMLHWHEWATPSVVVCYLSLFHLPKEWWDPVHPKFHCGSRDLLSIAAATGCFEMVTYLVERGAPVNPKDAECLDRVWAYPLGAASVYGNHEIVKYLLENGADLQLSSLIDENHREFGGRYGSALCAAARGGHLRTVQLLLEAGADVNLLLQARYYGSALAAAAAGGHWQTIRLLLEAGAEVNLLLQAGNYGSALYAAAAGRHLETIRLLLEAGADVNQLL